ncbi:MAG: hypothetical protein SPJ65_04085 [Roseburia sp.]|nr:hypothetical protein [Roseburia sp.]
MKRKTLFLLSILTISATLLSGCKSADSVDNSETIETTAIESEATEETETAVSRLESTSGNTTTTNSQVSSIPDIPESKGWPDYKKTADYYIESGQATESAMHVLNPDIYGTETAGKGTGDVPFDYIDASVDIRMMKVTTTKGYTIEAWYYVEAGTVQFIYTGEISPGGGWYTDPDSIDVLDAAFNYEKSALDITHEQKIEILGEPTMTAEEVIAALQ